MRRKTFVAALVIGQLLWTAVLTLSAAEVEPAALSLLRSGDLVILDGNQGLFLLRTRSGQVRRLGQGFGLFEGMDMAGAFLDGRDDLFVTLNLRSSKGGNQAQLVRYNAAGQRVGEWSLPGGLTRLSGVAVDARQKVAYVASTQPPEVYKVDLSRPRAPMVRMSGVRGAQRLGCMVLDARRGRLLIADPYLGRVYAYDLASGQSEVLLEKVGEVGGLALNPDADRLFIADAVGKRILVSNLAGRSTAPTPFAPQIQKQLDEPLGLALGGGNLWIADRDDEEVLLVSSAGQLVRTFSLERIAAPLSKKR